MNRHLALVGIALGSLAPACRATQETRATSAPGASSAASVAAPSSVAAPAQGDGADRCRGLSFEWSVARGACHCPSTPEIHTSARDCGRSDWPTGLTGTVIASAPTVASGRVLMLEIRYRNTTTEPLRVPLAWDADVLDVTTYDSTGSKVEGTLNFGWTDPNGLHCQSVPPGNVRVPVVDPAEVVLLPGGELTEKVPWHAAVPEREERTCGWNYRPLAPGHYRVVVEHASNPVEVVVTPREPCLATCERPADALILPFTKYPKLAGVGETVRVHVNDYKDPVCSQSDVLVAHTAENFVAVSGACTDACCPVTVTQSRLSRFACPWCPRSSALRKNREPHDWSQTYDSEGKPKYPQTTIPNLPVLPVCDDECGVVVRTH